MLQQTGNAADVAGVKLHRSLGRHTKHLMRRALHHIRSLFNQYRRAVFTLLLCAVLIVGAPLVSQLREYPLLYSPPVAVAFRHDEVQRLKALEAAKPSVVFISGEGRGSSEHCGVTGWVFDGEGHIVTCLSGIEEAARGSLRVRLADQTQVPARLVGVDRGSDLAVLEVQVPAGSRLQPLPQVAPGSLLLGQDLYVMGNPFGLDHTLTRGVMSGSGRSLLVDGQLPVQGAIMTDAAIDLGNSGGPVLTSQGQVAGMATAAARLAGADAAPAVRGGLVVPADAVAARARSILERGYVRRPSLGLHLGPDGLAERLGVQGGGAVVMEVARAGPAREAGVRAGDVVVALDGQPVQRADDVVEALSSREPGETVQLTLRRSAGAAEEAFSPGTQFKEFDLLVRLGDEHLSR